MCLLQRAKTLNPMGSLQPTRPQTACGPSNQQPAEQPVVGGPSQAPPLENDPAVLLAGCHSDRPEVDLGTEHFGQATSPDHSVEGHDEPGPRPLYVEQCSVRGPDMAVRPPIPAPSCCHVASGPKDREQPGQEETAQAPTTSLLDTPSYVLPCAQAAAMGSATVLQEGCLQPSVPASASREDHAEQNDDCCAFQARSQMGETLNAVSRLPTSALAQGGVGEARMLAAREYRIVPSDGMLSPHANKLEGGLRIAGTVANTAWA